MGLGTLFDLLDLVGCFKKEKITFKQNAMGFWKKRR